MSDGIISEEAFKGANLSFTTVGEPHPSEDANERSEQMAKATSRMAIFGANAHGVTATAGDIADALKNNFPEAQFVFSPRQESETAPADPFHVELRGIPEDDSSQQTAGALIVRTVKDEGKMRDLRAGPATKP